MGLFEGIRQITIGREASKTLLPTDPSVFHPGNLGPLDDGIRPVPVVTKQRTFNTEETAALGALSEVWNDRAKATAAAYKHLSSIEKAAADVQAADRAYRGQVMESELARLKANTDLVVRANKARTEYAALPAAISESDQAAELRIREAEARAAQLLRRLR